MLKRFSLAVSSIAAVGIAIKNMDNLTFGKVILYGIALLFSYMFLKAILNLLNRKSR